MRNVFILAFLVSMLVDCNLYAKSFYKWKDKNGVTHISDTPVDENGEQVTLGSIRNSESDVTVSNKSNIEQIQENKNSDVKAKYGSVHNQKHNDIDERISKLEAELRYLESQKRMNSEMERKGLRDEIEQKQNLLEDLQLERQGVSSADIARNRNERRQEELNKYFYYRIRSLSH